MIRLALIGGGKIGREIYKPAIDLDPESKIVAVCCQTSESLQWWRDVPSVKLLSRNWRDVVANENIDAVIIATPNHLHKSQVVEALNQGKHVLCEKPISTDIEDAKVLWSLAKNSDLTHMTAFTYRFAPAVRYIKHLIEEGDLGAIRHFRSQRFLDLPETSRGWKQDADKAGAGVLFAMLSHRLDYARYWLGDLDIFLEHVNNLQTADWIRKAMKHQSQV